MYLVTLIFFVFLAIQIIFGTTSKLLKTQIKRRFSGTILTSQINASEVLENYVKIYRSVGVRVDSKIKNIAKASVDFVEISKEQIYSTDLYSCVYLIHQLELTKKSNSLIRDSRKNLGVLFILQVLFILLAIFLPTEDSLKLILVLVGFSIQVISMLMLFVAFRLAGKNAKNVLDISFDLLNLDELEISISKELLSELRYSFLEYPVSTILYILKRIIFFFVPLR